MRFIVIVRVGRELCSISLPVLFWVFPQEKLLEAEGLEIGTFKLLVAEERAQRVKSCRHKDLSSVLAPARKLCTGSRA